MLTKRTKWVLVIIGLILGILSCVLACVNYIDFANDYNKKYPSQKSPIRTFSIQIKEDQREELFAQLRKFSEKHHLEFYLSFYKGKEIFFIEMYGEKLEILAQPIPDVPEEIYIRFYEKDPTNPPSQEKADELYHELKAVLSEIPNVKIIEEK